MMIAAGRSFVAVGLGIGLWLGAPGVARPGETTEPAKNDAPITKDAVDFARDVLPILSDNCFKCHGPDESTREADLRLDTSEGAREVLSEDKPEESEILARITAADPDDRMPPPDSKRELSRTQIETLRTWILQGANYQRHWAFTPIGHVPVPDVKRAGWPKNEIDRFILARLETEGLTASRGAGKEKLIRRLSFTLTGLPPTIEEIDAFLVDDSPDAYETLVDRMLSKTAYGERMASDWLDVARYSDTYGYQVDRDRFVWPWRDWVIDAFNANMPYDQFVTWQLAGDLLPDATEEQILATTFNRLHPQKVEGGSTPEEFRVEYVADRVHTFATALLGLTMECARCHDHKFDPITQTEYYQLFAFFNSIDEAGLYSYFTPAVPTPTLLLPDENQRARIAEVQRRIAQQEKKLQAVADARREPFGKWLEMRTAQADIPGRIAHLSFEEFKDDANVRVPGRVGKAVKLTGDDEIKLKVGNFRRFQPFSIALWLHTPDAKQRAVVFHRSGGWTDAGSRGYQLLIEDGRLSASLIHFWPGNAMRVRTTEPMPTGQWHHLTVTYDGSSRASGLGIHLNGKPVACEIVRDNLTKEITGGGGDNVSIGARFRDRGFTNGLVDEFQVFDRELTPPEIAQLHDGQSLSAALAKPVGALTDEDKTGLFAFYLATVDSAYREQLAALRTALEQRSEIVDPVAEIMVMRELPEPRPAYLLQRGAYDARGKEVSPDTPAIFPGFPKDQPRNRLGLARWLTGPDHPLTARVTVNRYWQLCFGRGLIRTPEDFGSQGEPPTHPELLDWLARDFIENGWDVKRLFKSMVMSKTYRQTSTASPELRKRDPDNRLLARAPRFRMPAEMIRDNTLAAGGLLVREIGGPPVRPYEVAVSFKPAEPDKGKGLYRRSIYTYWKRTGPAPVMMALDASKRDVCRVKRGRTSTPLQALVLLNDPQFVEAARVLGERMIRKHGDDTDASIVEMFRVLTSRQPSGKERAILRKLYADQLADFEENVEQARRFLKTGDWAPDASIPAPRLAAMGVVANALMNFNECVMVW